MVFGFFYLEMFIFLHCVWGLIAGVRRQSRDITRLNLSSRFDGPVPYRRRTDKEKRIILIWIPPNRRWKLAYLLHLCLHLRWVVP